MPLPLILGAAATVAVIGGVGSGINGAAKMKEAKDTVESADIRHKKNLKRFDDTSLATNKVMDELGAIELEILHSFDDFSNTIEKIHNRPMFKEYKKNGVELPKYDKEELDKVSVGAGVLLGGLGGAAVGTAGGFAAAGATTSAVMALGTASTGTAIASLSGAAATNATLAALGGGALAAGGGGIALGTTILGATTLGVGLLVGGVIFNITGNKLSEDADEIWDEMIKAEKTIETACSYLNDLKSAATEYTDTIIKVRNKYKEHFRYLSYVVNVLKKNDWNDFSDEERIVTENISLLVGLLYKMCKVNLVKKSLDDKETNTVNHADINESITNAKLVMNKL